MTYYEKLDISSHMGHSVIVGFGGGKYCEGVLEVDLINECWEEDGERESIGLLMDGKLTAIPMDTIRFILKTGEACHFAYEPA